MRRLIALLIFLLPFQSLFIYSYLFLLMMALLPFVLILAYSNNNIRNISLFIQRSRPLLPFIALFYFSIVLAYALSPGLSGQDLRWFLLCITSVGWMVLTTIYIRTPRDAVFLLRLLLFGAAMQFILYLLYKFHIIGSGIYAEYGVSGESRFQGSFSGYELLAEYLGLSVIIALGLITYNNAIRRSNRKIYIGILMIFMVGALTATRGFVISMVFPPLLFVLLYMRYSKRRGQLLKLLLFLVIVLSIGYNYLVPREVIDYNRTRIMDLEVSGERAFNRASMYVVAFGLLRGMPLTGYGTRMMEVFNNRMGGTFVSPHSIYLSMLLLAGYLGLFSIVLLLYKTLRWSYRSLSKRSKSDPYKGIDVALIVFWLFWAFSEAKIDAIRQGSYLSILMIYFGITNAMIKRDALPDARQETEDS